MRTLTKNGRAAHKALQDIMTSCDSFTVRDINRKAKVRKTYCQNAVQKALREGSVQVVGKVHSGKRGKPQAIYSMMDKQ